MQDGQGRVTAGGRFRHPASRAVQGRTSVARSRRLRATSTGTSRCGVEPDLILELLGGAGFTWQLGEELLGFALGTARLEQNRDFAAWLSPAAGFDGGLLWRNRAGNLLLEAQGDYFHNGEVRRRLSLTQQLELGDNLGLRLSAEREFSQWAPPVNEVQLQLRWYYY